MLDKKITQVIIQYPEELGKADVNGLIYVPIERVIGLEEKLEELVREKVEIISGVAIEWGEL